MPWTTVVDDQGQVWNLSQLGLWILSRQYVYNNLIRMRTRVERIGYWPERAQLHTDFDHIRADTDREAGRLYETLSLQLQEDGQLARRSMIELRAATHDNVRYVRRLQEDASRETWRNIETCVHRAEIGLEVARQVRNYSATTLVVGSSLMGGGGAVALLAMGSGLSGVGQYQDTGNIGSAVVTATGTFVTGLIPLRLNPGTIAPGAALTTRVVSEEAIRHQRRVGIVFIGASVNAGTTLATGLIEGRRAEPVIRATATRLGLDLASGMLGIGLDHLPFPVVARLVTDQAVDIGGRIAGARAAARNRTPGASGRMQGSRAAVAVRQAPAPQPHPTNPVCDANALLSTGDCSAEQWVEQLVLRPEW